MSSYAQSMLIYLSMSVPFSLCSTYFNKILITDISKRTPRTGGPRLQPVPRYQISKNREK